ncbi:MAG TPA: Hpt domain-containing protein [Micropepsaceae bacterium]|jgi:HPt (histidine-containing phosphotransfer) domain-containing protein
MARTDKPRTDQPVDLDHLDRYTGGDRAINQEILRLFDDQCRESLAMLEYLAQGSGDSQSWREIAHRLKGAARGIGAFALGDAAAVAEKTAPEEALAVLERLRDDAAAVHNLIAEFLKASA